MGRSKSSSGASSSLYVGLPVSRWSGMMNRIFEMLTWVDSENELDPEELLFSVRALTTKMVPDAFQMSLHWFRALKLLDKLSVVAAYKEGRARGIEAREGLVAAEVRRISNIVSICKRVRRARSIVLNVELEQRDELLPAREVRVRKARRAYRELPSRVVEKSLGTEECNGRFCPDCFGLAHRRPLTGKCPGCRESHDCDVHLFPIPTAGCGLGDVA